MKGCHLIMFAPSYSESALTGSQRAFSFARHLPANGVRVSVITIGTRYEKTVGKFNENIYCVLSPLLWMEELVRRLGRFSGKQSGKGTSGNLNRSTPNQSDLWYKRPFNMPDQHWAWAFLAYVQAVRIHNHDRIDAVLSTSPAESAHIAARLLKMKHGIPWIADLRDGWMFEPYKVVRLRRGPRRTIELFLEKILLRQADRITTVTRPIGDDLVNRLQIPRSRVEILPNGFEPDEWQVSREAVSGAARRLGKTGRPIIILHMGRISSASMDRRADNFFEALARLKKERYEIFDEMKFLFYGTDSKEESALVKRLGITEAVTFFPRIPKKEAVLLMMAADGLLLITSNSQSSIATSKLFDYMAAGKPVFALARGNAAEDIIKETHIGLTVSPMDVDDIYDKLVLFHSDIRRGTSTQRCCSTTIKHYERGRQVARLADMIKSIA